MLTYHHTRDDFENQRCTTAVLPIGAVEQHGRHLPVGTDVMLAESLAGRLAERLDAYLLPPLAVTSSVEHRKTKGTVYLRADTLALVIRDIASSLRDSGFTRLILANFHGGNWILKPTIRQLNRDLADFRTILLAPELPAAEAEKIFEHATGDVHGGEYETSLMLHLHPQHVRKFTADATPETFSRQAFLDYFDTAELTRHGHWGWPAAATAEKGRQAFEHLVEASLAFIAEIDAHAAKLAEPPPPSFALRQLTEADLAFACELNALAGWNQTEKDWRGYLEFEPDGCFVAETDGKRAGTATTIRYGNRFGWIGMVLVHPDFRRFGIGTKLLRAAIAYLQKCGVAAVKLDATPMGRKVYVPLGFVDEYEMSRYDGMVLAGVAMPEAVTPLLTRDVAEVAAFDAPIFGADREPVLRSMVNRNPDLSFVLREGGAVRGYLLARQGRIATQIGPWEADDSATAEQLLRALFTRIPAKRLFVDVLHPNPSARAMMEKYGFTIQRSLTRMFLGENRNPGTPEKIFGISSPEKG
jgi:creatinine amidohydrolase